MSRVFMIGLSHVCIQDWLKTCRVFSGLVNVISCAFMIGKSDTALINVKVISGKYMKPSHI